MHWLLLPVLCALKKEGTLNEPTNYLNRIEDIQTGGVFGLKD